MRHEEKLKNLILKFRRKEVTFHRNSLKLCVI